VITKQGPVYVVHLNAEQIEFIEQNCERAKSHYEDLDRNHGKFHTDCAVYSGRAGEVAFCILLRDYGIGYAYSPSSTEPWDVRIGNELIDVKTSDRYYWGDTYLKINANQFDAKQRGDTTMYVACALAGKRCIHIMGSIRVNEINESHRKAWGQGAAADAYSIHETKLTPLSETWRHFIEVQHEYLQARKVDRDNHRDGADRPRRMVGHIVGRAR